jgi:fused signal recognition particle receptor
LDFWTEYSTFLPYVIGILAGVGLVVWIARKAKAEQRPPVQAPKAESKSTSSKALSEAPVAPEPEAKVELEPTEDVNWRARLSGGLTKTRGAFAGLGKLFEGEFTEELEEEIEETLLTSDLGMSVTQKVIENLRQAVKEKGLKGDQIHAELRAQLSAILAPCQGEWVPGEGTQVIMMVGVNGAGKTTTLGKLAAKHKAAGRSVMLAAGDTFRAAAVEQLKTWGERAQVPVVAQDTGADSASVIFDALSSARAKQTDILLADTAGRLQNKDHLMDELSKVVRVLKKQDEQAPHEVLLVLDAGTGQNALSQAELFTQAVGVTGLVLTKLDGTAKGGVAFAIADKMGLPIRYIGVGEGIADLQPFDADAFVAALFDDA